MYNLLKLKDQIWQINKTQIKTRYVIYKNQLNSFINLYMIINGMLTKRDIKWNYLAPIFH